LATLRFKKGVTQSFSDGWQNHMYYVYLLKLKNKSIYTGSTPNLERRIKEHNSGQNKSTKYLIPVELLWSC
jgi:predicted GIY-YIG superfamily endonuclease